MRKEKKKKKKKKKKQARQNKQKNKNKKCLAACCQTWVPGALEAVHGDHVGAQLDGFERVADRHAFVDHDNPGRLEQLDVLLWITAGRLHHGNFLLDDDVAVAREIGVHRHGKQGQVAPERLVGERFAFADFFAQIFRRWLGECGDDAQPTSVGHRCRKAGVPDVVHTTLDQRVLDPKDLRDAGFQDHFLVGGGWVGGMGLDEEKK